MRFQLAASSLALMTVAACNGAPPPADTAAPAAPESQTGEPALVPASTPALEQLWIQTGFEAPEGAALAPDGGYFISNVAGEGSEKDGNGFISKLAADGTIEALRWAEGLDAPKGMAVSENVLYVADIDRVVSLDATTGAQLAAVGVENAQFLNDVTVWKGDVLVSDSGSGSIYRITPDGADLLGASADWAGINGLLGDGDRLLISTMAEGHLIEFYSSDSEAVIATGMKNADGIGLVPGGGYLVSSWPGQIHYVSQEGEVTTLLNVEEEGILQNDLSVFGDVVIVPNWMPGTVTAWRVARP